jgi:hypothetical protein
MELESSVRQKVFIIYFIKCIIVTNLNCMYNISLNGGELRYFNINAETTSLQQSVTKEFVRFTRNLAYKFFTKGCRSHLRFIKIGTV